jgi:hypothetical protein
MLPPWECAAGARADSGRGAVRQRDGGGERGLGQRPSSQRRALAWSEGAASSLLGPRAHPPLFRRLPRKCAAGCMQTPTFLLALIWRLAGHVESSRVSVPLSDWLTSWLAGWLAGRLAGWLATDGRGRRGGF